MAETTDRTLPALSDGQRLVAPNVVAAVLPLAVVVSESAVVRIFEGRDFTGEGLPGLGLLEHHGRRDLPPHRPGRS